MKSFPRLRWGILGTANIARKNWQALRLAEHATLVAVASRDLARAERFVHDCQAAVPFAEVPQALGSYEELLAYPDIDAVYIPLPTGVRLPWVLHAAAAGKHVVCEKPCAVNAGDLRRMIDACAAAGVAFMDGVMFMHSRRLDALRTVLDDGHRVGPLRRITSAFTFRGDEAFFRDNIRGRTGLEPQGCLGDLGWYNIRFALWAQRGALPVRVAARAHRTVTAAQGGAEIPVEVTAELDFADGVTAGFHCSFLAADQQWAVLSGELGSVRLDDFVLPFRGDSVVFHVSRPEFQVRGCDFNMIGHHEICRVPERSNSHASAQETRLFEDFSAAVLARRIDPTWADFAWKTQLVLDACCESCRQGGAPVTLGDQ